MNATVLEKLQPLELTSYKLMEPIKWGSEVVSELPIGKLKAKHIRGMATTPTMNDLLGLAQQMTDRPAAFIDELSLPDSVALLEIVGKCFAAGRQTGSNA